MAPKSSASVCLSSTEPRGTPTSRRCVGASECLRGATPTHSRQKFALCRRASIPTSCRPRRRTHMSDEDDDFAGGAGDRTTIIRQQFAAAIATVLDESLSSDDGDNLPVSQAFAAQLTEVSSQSVELEHAFLRTSSLRTHYDSIRFLALCSLSPHEHAGGIPVGDHCTGSRP